MAMDPYQILGVDKGAADEDIRKAFRRLAKELHPDVNPENTAAAERFKHVSAAYEILGDPPKRRLFDSGEIDANGEPKRGFSRAGAGAGRARGAHAGGGFAGFTGFSDIFEDVFGANAGARTGERGRYGATGYPSRGVDLRYTLEVDFIEALTGVKKRVTLPEGGVLDLTVPEGIGDGQVLRLKGKGAEGIAGGQPGDALVEIKVRSHPLFNRMGDDIHTDVPITIDEAILGGKIEVSTVSGRVQLALPKGTATGRVFRLRGKGVKNSGSGQTGDHLVTVRVVMPPNIDDELAYFFSEWRQRHSYDPGRR